LAPRLATKRKPATVSRKRGGGVRGAIPMSLNNVPDADLKTPVACIPAQK
jgi:hypothetical protein